MRADILLARVFEPMFKEGYKLKGNFGEKYQNERLL
jgi:hypothetical protein